MRRIAGDFCGVGDMKKNLELEGAGDRVTRMWTKERAEKEYLIQEAISQTTQNTKQVGVDDGEVEDTTTTTTTTQHNGNQDEEKESVSLQGEISRKG